MNKDSQLHQTSFLHYYCDKNENESQSVSTWETLLDYKNIMMSKVNC